MCTLSSAPDDSLAGIDSLRQCPPWSASCRLAAVMSRQESEHAESEWSCGPDPLSGPVIGPNGEKILCFVVRRGDPIKFTVKYTDGGAEPYDLLMQKLAELNIDVGKLYYLDYNSDLCMIENADDLAIAAKWSLPKVVNIYCTGTNVEHFSSNSESEESDGRRREGERRCRRLHHRKGRHHHHYHPSLHVFSPPNLNCSHVCRFSCHCHCCQPNFAVLPRCPSHC
ncbi:unnamed protein product [Heligmosomoides polygyrus]|uniref:PB1 domain-containing protein n=1 Tax=Heligmosomoides polygyrus TaxID=6339 RepID=A0A183G7R1_HELPZ|nr:unnamed protein product [Heligmosomoides polygyrus]